MLMCDSFVVLAKKGFKRQFPLINFHLSAYVSRKMVYENITGYWTVFDSGNLLFNLQIWVLSRFQVETRRFSWEDDCAPWQQILLREVNTSLCRTHSSNTRLQPNVYSVSNLIHNCRSKGKDWHFKGTTKAQLFQIRSRPALIMSYVLPSL